MKVILTCLQPVTKLKQSAKHCVSMVTFQVCYQGDNKVEVFIWVGLTSKTVTSVSCKQLQLTTYTFYYYIFYSMTSSKKLHVHKKLLNSNNGFVEISKQFATSTCGHILICSYIVAIVIKYFQYHIILWVSLPIVGGCAGKSYL